jgi:hypothetical protein
LTPGTLSSFDSTENRYIDVGINEVADAADYFDIWALADATLYSIRNAVDPLSSAGLTYIVSQDLSSKYYAQVCAKNYYFRQTSLGTGETWGSSLFLQMR